MCVSGCVYRTADSYATVRGEVAGDPGQFVTPSVQLCVSGCVYSTVDSDATVRGEVAGGPGQFVTPSVHLCVCVRVCI